MLVDMDDKAIIQGIIELAKVFNRKVIAEGVETETQLRFLQSHGCHLIQGHYFNPSFSEQELLRIVLNQDGYVLQQPVAIDMAYNE